MEVASPPVLPSSGDGGEDAPFRERRDVREWQRVDCATGAFERARFEADRWTTRDDGRGFNHHYGKLVDSLLRTDPENGFRQAASRQLEVFRSRGPAGTVHVVRTRTLASCTTSSSSSRSWTVAGTTGTASSGTYEADAVTAAAPLAVAATAADDISQDFQNLQLSVNPLDVTQQKSKASVCRNATRRPPTQQRSYRRAHQQQQQPMSDGAATAAGGGVATPLGPAHAVAAANLHRVSRLCHQIHASAVKQAFGGGGSTLTPTHAKRDADADADATTAGTNATVEIVELESTSSDSTNTAHTNLVRTKSSSSEDIHHIPPEQSNSINKSIEDLDDFDQLQTWRRTSKIRRSLQFPKQNKQQSTSTSKPVDIPENRVSVKKIKEDLEKGRRLNTVLRNNSVDLEALDQILQSISGSSSDKNSEELESETYKKQKRNSFVTVESIQEVKGRLRRTSSPSSDIYKENGKDDDPDADADADADDGIVVEETLTNGTDTHQPTEKSRVKSYVYGMEALLNKKPGIGTGSLESRVKLVNGNSTAKNEDWYNRRKSYGFEQVQTQEDSSNCILKSKKLVESSTDSGICRSSEMVSKTNNSYNENRSIIEDDQDHKVNGWKEITTGQVKKLANTYDSSAGRGTTSAASAWPKPTELKSTTITIPIVKNNNVVDLPWYDDGGGRDIKRHSIAVDESQYVRRALPMQQRRHRRTSLVSVAGHPLEDEAANAIRRTKKVEFCKTEVHFAAESGKVNIVATDEKPPPTQNFRRRRRNSGPLADDFGGGGDGKGGKLPVLRFGDSSEEQCMFGLAEAATAATGAIAACTQASPRLRRHDVNLYDDSEPRQMESGAHEAPDNRKMFGVVTVNAAATATATASYSDACCQNEAAEGLTDEDRKDLSESEIKGILKNKPIKPKPYHLGEAAVPVPGPVPIVTYPSSSDEETSKWGVKLRHVEKPPPAETPIWKSTVTVHNFYEKNSQQVKEVEEGETAGAAASQEFQKRLRSLRPTKKATAPECGSDSSADNKRSCWSMEDGQSMEHRGYSTKINFGEGEATVVENDDREGNTTWPRVSEGLPNKDSKQLLQKGLVVRIEKEDHALNHTVRSKITTTGSENNTTTTTTKITIDLSPSPLPERDHFSAHQRSHFKSTSLILSTIKDKTAKKQQREPLGETKKSNGYQNHLRAHSKPASPQKMKTLHKDDDDVLINVRNQSSSLETYNGHPNNYLKVPKVNQGLRKIDIKDLKHNHYNPTSFDNHENLKTSGKVLLESRNDVSECPEQIFEHSRSSGSNTMAGSQKVEEHIEKTENIQNGNLCSVAHTKVPSLHQRSLRHPDTYDQLTTKDIRGEEVSFDAHRTARSSYRLDSPRRDNELVGCQKTISSNSPFSVKDRITSSSDNDHRRLDESLDGKRELLLRSINKTTAAVAASSSPIASGAVNSTNRRQDLKTKTEREAKTVNGGGALWCQNPRYGVEQNSLEMLKRLYEDANSGGSDCDAAADKEVQQLMSSSSSSRANKTVNGQTEEDGSSVVSGSWSKMRAYRILWENRTKFAGSSKSFGAVAKEKDSALLLHTTTNSPSVKVTARNEEESFTSRHPSPIQKSDRNSWPPVRPDLTPIEKLSSPSLVGKTDANQFNTAVDHKLQSKHTTENIVLRQPKKSEMTYFGIKVSPSPKKKVSQAVIRRETKLSENPDLLQHHTKSTSSTRGKYNKPRQSTPEPIYENVHSDNKYRGRVFDSSILDELTKAADQILEAVNGYTDEDGHGKQSTDEEKKKLETIVEAKSWKQNAAACSADGTKPSNMKSKLKHTSSTSSVESITKKRTTNEKTTTTTTTTERQQNVQQRKKQEKSDSSTSSKANLKARRLQRASSREALLHSHGSSSEDIPNRTEVVVRKPRLVKKTKAVQLTMTNGLELKKPNSIGSSAASTAARKKEDQGTSKADERILNSLPEIRHKTAVSTIRSTSEKLTKDGAKYKHEDTKKKTPTKRDTNKGTTATVTAVPSAGSSSNCSSRPVHQSGRLSTSKSSTPPPPQSTVTGSVKAAKGDCHRLRPRHQSPAPAVTQHRISTANIKKCCGGGSRSEGVKP